MKVKKHYLGTSANWVFFRRQNIYRSNDELYLIRWELFRCPWFSIKLHKIILSDDACLHDHPWSFLSIILWGGYNEWRPTGNFVTDGITRFMGPQGDILERKAGPGGEILHKKWHPPLSILYRKRPARHSIEVGNKPAWTLVVTAPKRASWGFYTKQGFVNWRDYDQNTMKCD